VSDLNGPHLAKFHRRSSDCRSRDRMNIPEEELRTRTRTRSSTDLVQRFGTLQPGAVGSQAREEVRSHGTASQRKEPFRIPRTMVKKKKEYRYLRGACPCEIFRRKFRLPCPSSSGSPHHVHRGRDLRTSHPIFSSSTPSSSETARRKTPSPLTESCLKPVATCK
jgi:hypothetical protein